MNRRYLLSAALALGLSASITPLHAQTLKETLGKDFLVGAALNVNVVNGRDERSADIVRKHFNSIVAENCMKGEVIHPEEGRYDWTDADATVKFGEENGQTVIGHCLVWHSQPPKWMFTDKEGKPVTRAVLIDRMYHHITEVVSRYKGRIKGWDVINEAFNDDGTYRQTPYYKIIGPDYFELAFKFAHEADPNAELYYNDYSLAVPTKRDAVVRLVKHLKEKGCRIDAVGMQSHVGYAHPSLEEYEKSIEAFVATGVKVQMTEFDMNMLPNPKSFSGAEISQNFQYQKELNPYTKGLTKQAAKLFEQRYLDFFSIIERHKKDILRVTLWGVTDATSWLNDFPVHGRTNYPLLFDREYKEKPVVKKIIKLFEANRNKQ